VYLLSGKPDHKTNVENAIVGNNGVGSDSAEHSFGLLGMRERVQLLGGTLSIDTAPNAGFELTAAMPG
jgi:signal transduction histidine kinase